MHCPALLQSRQAVAITQSPMASSHCLTSHPCTLSLSAFSDLSALFACSQCVEQLNKLLRRLSSHILFSTPANGIQTIRTFLMTASLFRRHNHSSATRAAGAVEAAAAAAVADANAVAAATAQALAAAEAARLEEEELEEGDEEEEYAEEDFSIADHTGS